VLFSLQWLDVLRLRVKRRLNRCDQRFPFERLLEHYIVAELALEARPFCITADQQRLEGRPHVARESYCVGSRQSGHRQIHDHQIAGFIPLEHGQRGATVIGLGNGAADFSELLGGDSTDIGVVVDDEDMSSTDHSSVQPVRRAG